MKKYSSYKDSGVKWLGSVPSHWEVKRLANFFSERKQKVSDKDFKPLSVTKTGILPQLENVAKTDDGENRKLVLRGDFVINSRSDRKGSSGVSNYDGSVSLINIVLCPKSGIVPEFCNYYLKSCSFIEEFYRNGHGIVADLWTTRYDEMKMIKIAVPSIEEQKKIIAYLNSATAKIDKAIAQQQRMIDLLNERKQNIINKTALQGLNPDVETANSGNDWLGQIPAHWKVNKFRYLFKTRTGISFTKAQLDDNGESVISYGQIHSKENWGASVNPELIKHIPSSLTQGKENALAYPGDFLFADTSEDFEGCGNNVYIDSATVYAGYHTILAKKNNEEYGPYLAYLFTSNAWRGQLRSMVNGVKVYSITQTLLNSVNVVLPPLKEQKEIASYLNKRIDILDKGIKRKKEFIRILQERKQILINAVVTGSIKVF